MKSRYGRYILLMILAIIAIELFIYLDIGSGNIFRSPRTGDVIDSLSGVYVYYDADGNNTTRLNVSDEFHTTINYPSEEFVERYYLENYQHQMPMKSGHPKDYYLKGVPDGELNRERGLIQYRNPSKTKPAVGDILVYASNVHNQFGHVAIIAKVTDNRVEIIQQNTGKRTRATYVLNAEAGKYEIKNPRVLGWLRKSDE